MSRMKEHHWPEERAPRPPSPIKSAWRAAWKEFRRVREQQKHRDSIPDPFRSNT